LLWSYRKITVSRQQVPCKRFPAGGFCLLLFGPVFWYNK
jgi:hypothetical protein